MKLPRLRDDDDDEEEGAEEAASVGTRMMPATPPMEMPLSSSLSFDDGGPCLRVNAAPIFCRRWIQWRRADWRRDDRRFRRRAQEWHRW